MGLAGIILAAGKGTRMKSEVPKVLHLCAGLPMVELVARALRGAGVDRTVVVVGHGADLVKIALGDSHTFALQEEQNGTGHATLMARDALTGFDGHVLVTAGDTPLLTAEALREVADQHLAANAVATVATFVTDNPYGYGRVVRGESGAPARIVEEKDASPEERQIREVNSGVYCFEAQALFELLPQLGAANAQGEIYLTDVVAKLASSGRRTLAVELKEELFMGVNDRWQLAEASRLMNQTILRRHCLNGVTIVDPASTWIGADVTIGPDTVIEPMTTIGGNTKIGAKCHLGPQSKIDSSVIGDECRVLMSHLNAARMEAGSKCGPFAHLRPGAVLGEGARVGNFVEVKNATLGSGSAANHLTYIGDAKVGAKANIGAGTITCNYDGFRKHTTEIGEGAFVGSNSTLVAPVTIGDGAFVAAGSVITKDVSADALAFGRARQEEKEGWAQRWREKNKS